MPTSRLVRSSMFAFQPAPQRMLDTLLRSCTYESFNPPGLFFLDPTQPYFAPRRAQPPIARPGGSESASDSEESADGEVEDCSSAEIDSGAAIPAQPALRGSTICRVPPRPAPKSSASHSATRLRRQSQSGGAAAAPLRTARTSSRGVAGAAPSGAVPQPNQHTQVVPFCPPYGTTHPDVIAVIGTSGPQRSRVPFHPTLPTMKTRSKGTSKGPKIAVSVTYRLLDVGVPGIAPGVLFAAGDTTGEAATLPFSVQMREITVPPAQHTRRGVLFHLGEDVVAFKVLLNLLYGSGLCHTSTSRWNMLWAKRLDPPEYSTIGVYNRVNHFPGAWGIGRKDALAQRMAAMASRFPADYNFAPDSWVLPNDSARLADAFSVARSRAKPMYAIIKPVASACGRGIRIISKCPKPPAVARGKDPPKKLVQRYITPPLLVAGHKFDLRMYVVLASVDPLRIYVFEDGLARFASAPYVSPRSSKSKYVHLTNHSINRVAAAALKATAMASGASSWNAREESAASSDSDCDIPPELSSIGPQHTNYGEEPFKWSVSSLKRYFADHGVPWQPIAQAIHDVIIKTIIAIEEDLLIGCSRVRIPHRDAVLQFFGFDIMLDASLKAYLIEVNIMPSLATTTELDRHVKQRFLAGLLTLSHTVPFDRAQYRAAMRRTGGNCTPARRFLNSAAHDLSTRISALLSKKTLSQYALDVMDQFVLATTEAEARRAMLCGFERVFPFPDSYETYGKFFSGPRYFNLLVSRFERDKMRVLDELETESISRPSASSSLQPPVANVSRAENLLAGQ